MQRDFFTVYLEKVRICRFHFIEGGVIIQQGGGGTSTCCAPAAWVPRALPVSLIASNFPDVPSQTWN